MCQQAHHACLYENAKKLLQSETRGGAHLEESIAVRFEGFGGDGQHRPNGQVLEVAPDGQFSQRGFEPHFGGKPVLVGKQNGLCGGKERKREK